MSLRNPALPAAESDAFAALLRRFRAARRMSQLDLALDCDVSPRHLSFLETGRAKPSREMVLQICEGLTLPLGSQNALLKAAGYAAVFPDSPLESEALGPFRVVLREMMDRHAPWPAILCDRHWRVRGTNATAAALLTPLQAEAGETSLVRILTDNPAAEAMIANLPEVVHEMRGRIALEALEAAGDLVLRDLLTALDAASLRHPLPGGVHRRPLVPLIINVPRGQLSFLSTIAHFGTSEDVTIRDLRLELLFPADDFTRTALKAMAS
ncbi:MAG: helix-turn-helix domain-containing protein [Hyphomonas sp.]|nr:helix-turn-helix domain-containing protein [Hyphomonas sp.]